MATEETKPVEREVFEKWAEDHHIVGQLIGLERQGDGYLAEAVNDSWEVWHPAWQASADAALERAATVADNMAHDLESRADGCDVQGLLTSVLRQRAIARRQVADAILALKGSR